MLLQKVDAVGDLSILPGELFGSRLLANVDVVRPLTCLAHSVHDLIVVFVNSFVSSCTSGIKEFVERETVCRLIWTEQGQVVLVITDDRLEVRLACPGC